MTDYLKAAQELNLGVEIRFEGDKCILTAFGQDITFNQETGEWRADGISSDDPEALLEYIKVLKDEADTPRVSAGDSSEPEGRGESSSDNRPEGESKPARK